MFKDVAEGDKFLGIKFEEMGLREMVRKDNCTWLWSKFVKCNLTQLQSKIEQCV